MKSITAISEHFSLLLFLSIAMPTTYLFGQQTIGTLKIVVRPTDATVKIDNRQIHQMDTQGLYYQVLDTGKHSFQILAPTYKTKEGTVNVLPNDTVFMGKYLVFSDQFRKYKRKEKGKQRFRSMLRILPPIAIIGFSAQYFLGVGKTRTEMEDSELVVYQRIEDYDNATTIKTTALARTEYQSAKFYYDSKRNAHNKFVRNQVIKISAATVGMVGAYWLASKMKAQPFIETPAMSNVNLGLDPFSNSLIFTFIF